MIDDTITGRMEVGKASRVVYMASIWIKCWEADPVQRRFGVPQDGAREQTERVWGNMASDPTFASRACEELAAREQAERPDGGPVPGDDSDPRLVFQFIGARPPVREK